MSENPDDIRSGIEETRRRLGTNVDAVDDKVTPSHVVRRQTEKVKDAVFGMKENVMGAADDLVDGGRSAIGDAPREVARKTQGNPLAAGLIAFGAGLLVASLIPASEKEREAAVALKDAAEPLTTELADAAKDVAQDLREPAQEAVENVRVAASEAVDHVKEQGQTAVSDVTETAAEAKDRIQPA